jgi:hypothetical protein
LGNLYISGAYGHSVVDIQNNAKGSSVGMYLTIKEVSELIHQHQNIVRGLLTSGEVESAYNPRTRYIEVESDSLIQSERISEGEKQAVQEFVSQQSKAKSS